eukprot:TRINITY_DN22654_c0_g1_i1.p5 TRINITY_DN22654_c0_g1~~TRINITY_DN22654_c0_g1_i1.p5  ORF type:complete len:154 (+),score=75.43 TRINITY_DN22654_c0_g1_i1:188-649(+)
MKEFLHGQGVKEYPAIEVKWTPGASPTLRFINEFGKPEGDKVALDAYDEHSIARVLAKQGITKQTPKMQYKKDVIKPTENCIAFRATSGCKQPGTPGARREETGDEACNKFIYATQSGQCECKDKKVVKTYGCHEGRAPFTCEEACVNLNDQY